MEGSFGGEVPQANHFEQQFARKEVIQTTAGRTELVDIEPLSPKDRVPVFFAPGWGDTPQAYKESLKIIHDGGRRVLSVSHPRRTENITGEDPDYPMAEIRKMQSLIGVISQKRLGKVDVIAHSEGAMYAIIAATLHPDKFRNIVLVSPGGLIGEDKFHKLVGRMLWSSVCDTMQAMKSPHEIDPLTNAAKEIVKYFAKNPKRAIEELHAIAQSDILEMIKNLHDGGIGISVVAGVDDPIFPAGKVLKVIGGPREINEKGWGFYPEAIGIGFYSVKGGHNKIITDEKYTRVAINALDDLRDKSKSKSERIAAENNADTSPS